MRDQTSGLRFNDSSCCLKRKRPPKIEIPNVLREIQAGKLEATTPRTDSLSSADFADHVGVFSVKGKKRFMEDTHRIISCMKGHFNDAFFGVYDGHGGRKAAKFVAQNLHKNILQVVANCTESAQKEEAIKAAFLKTDGDFLNLGLGSGVCCVTALIQGEELVVSNLGDCRAVLSRGGVAEAVTKDHRVEQEDERKRIENKGGYVEIHRGAWRVHGVLSVSRSIGDAHLKDWVLAEPDSKVLLLSEDMEFLVLATDGLWEKVGNQETVDVVTRLRLMDKSFGLPKCSLRSTSHAHCSVNLSPSKLRRVSLVTQPKGGGMDQSPICDKAMDSSEEAEYDYSCETESPRTKSRRISLVRHKKMKTESSPKENNDSYRKRPTSSRLVAACKELVDLALSRGSLDDITVIIVDLSHFRCETMHDSIGIPACFSFGERPSNDPASVIRPGQSVFMSVYQTKIVGQCRLITVTWCKNLLLHGLSICVQGPEGNQQYQCKVEMKPWYFWRKQGSKHFEVDGRAVDVFWDLKSAKFNGETEPQSDYYVAVVCEEEVVLLIGDLKKDAFRKTGCRPALIEPTLVSKKEHVFGKKMFSTRIQFHEKGKFHTISIEFININNPSFSDSFDPELEMRIDGQPAIKIKHLHWKFRGNESVLISRTRLEVYWDVHDWLFGSGSRYGLFIFRPMSSWSESPSSSLASTTSLPAPSSSLTPTGMSIREVISTSGEDENAAAGVSSKFCLFLYAWKME
ncbi:uncharacterized protein LOC111799255 [Cucurbita pepo subsp. pepo]|uniref:uncharacterized protein LOC111799255 n=1 Tax=Cucurbita pepo subsp. pepo TaxID=3664 RepID=UPI000C9D62EB|nr:uncharacterized protein LOC111799255 [Cucurbita pepo subsp. pepo]